MITFKCKMCGGDLHPDENATTCECEYCGSVQTVPTADNEKKMNLIARAQRLLRACEFDKAAGIYESVVAEFPGEAEAYWGLVLCKYGIEYVDDPATGKKVPTCHRSSFDSLMDDANFEQACENTDAVARRLYRDEAKTIEELRKRVIEVSGKEEPYDIFICYKETDENGNRTLDSVLAQDIYNELTEKGYRVFFSRITLEDKLGQEYEPYIFAALNSAKIMLVVGTDYEYYNAVWVKNEWSRFLKLIAAGEKKTLIPCYKGIDAYDMPKEFARLQAQDMGKIGAMQDLVRGIEKIVTKNPTIVDPISEHSGGPNVEALSRRGFMALEDGDWSHAIVFFDQILNMDAQQADAYLGLTLAKANMRNQNDLSTISSIKKLEEITGSNEFQRFQRFASKEYQQRIDDLLKESETVIRNKKIELTKARRQNSLVRGLISTSSFHFVGVKTDGTVIACGDNDGGQCDVEDLTDIVQIGSKGYFTIALRSDGTVKGIGYDKPGEGPYVDYICSEVNSWVDITTIGVGELYAFGVHTDGTVIISPDLDDEEIRQICRKVKKWNDISAIATTMEVVVGLKKDGTVVTTVDNLQEQCKGWTDIVAIAAGAKHIVGLKSDGTVVATGDNEYQQCNVDDWTDIVAIAAGAGHTVGLRTDGTVVAVGTNDGECDVEQWRDIVAVFAAVGITVGLSSGGRLTVAGDLGSIDAELRESISRWKLFDSIETIEQEREKAIQRIQQERLEADRLAEESRKDQITSLNREKESLQAELSKLKGVFSVMRRKTILNRIAEIDNMLKQL